MPSGTTLSLFQQIAATVGLATVLGAIAVLLRQPLLVAFIAAGVLVGPAGFGLVRPGEPFDSLAELGIALLLFLVGLRLDVSVARRMGPPAAIAGALQVAVTAGLGFGLAMLLGFGPVVSAYLGAALAFSSTVIIVKLLADQREIDSLHGRLSVGILIVQDLVVILALIAISAFAAPMAIDAGAHKPGPVDIVIRGGALLVGVWLLGKFVLPLVLERVARSSEALVLFGLAWAMSMGCAAEFLGFSVEVGAFLAGVSLASTRYRDTIGGRLVGVRDFLLVFFFVALGASVRLDELAGALPATAAFALFVLIGKPLIAMAALGLIGYRRRTSFMAGCSLGQLSEFSLILVAIGVESGHLGSSTVSLLTMLFLVTVVPSSYLILTSQQCYERFGSRLPILERRRRRQEESAPEPGQPCDAIVIGLGRFGRNIAQAMDSRGSAVLGVDFDPDAVAAARRHRIEARYLDAEDPEEIAALPLGSVRWVICAVPSLEINRGVLAALRAAEFAGRVAVTAHSHADADILRRLGADEILLPFVDAAHEAADRLSAVGG
jgi:Kef-type K+ transport system membrane component KefB